MPIPIGALIALMSGNQPPPKEPENITDLLMRPDVSESVTSIPWIERKSKGVLADERGPPALPQLQLRDAPGYAEGNYRRYPSHPMGGSGAMEEFPLLPIGDVVPFPKPGPDRGPQAGFSYLPPDPKVTPGVAPLSNSTRFWEDYMYRALNRKRIEDMGGLRG